MFNEEYFEDVIEAIRQDDLFAPYKTDRVYARKWHDAEEKVRADMSAGKYPTTERFLPITIIEGHNKIEENPDIRCIRKRYRIRYEGEWYTIAELAQHPNCKVCHNTLRERIIRAGMDIKSSVENKKMNTNGL